MAHTFFERQLRAAPPPSSPQQKLRRHAFSCLASFVLSAAAIAAAAIASPAGEKKEGEGDIFSEIEIVKNNWNDGFASARPPTESRSSFYF